MGIFHCNSLGKGLACGIPSLFPLDVRVFELSAHQLADPLTLKSGQRLLRGVQPWPCEADPRVLRRREDPVGDAGAELPAPEAASRDQHGLRHKGRASRLPGGEGLPTPCACEPLPPRE